MFPVLFNPSQSHAELRYTKKVLALGPIAYWPMAEPSGTVALDATPNARNGAYTSVTLAQPGIGDGRTSALFGAASYNNVSGASLAAAFSGAAGSACGWAKANTAIWTDGGQHHAFCYLVNVSNYVRMMKNTTNNTLTFEYVAGGTSKVLNDTSMGGSAAWFHFGVTWDKAADQVKCYLNGLQVGATLTGLGTFAGALSATDTVVGSRNTTPTATWVGNLAHAPIFTRAVTAAEMLNMATL